MTDIDISKDRGAQAALLALLDTMIDCPGSFASSVVAHAARQARDMIVALDSSATARTEQLREYGTHGRRSDNVMCERDKHADYPCTCGFEAALEGK